MLATIQQQCQECERLQSLPYVNRQSRYDISLLLQNPQIKLITSPRRVGKSIFALILSETLLYSGIDANAIHPDQEADARMAYEEYLRLGGYPETLQAHQMTGSYLLSNICNLFTTLSFCEDLGMNSENTVKKFCGYLHEPYQFYYLPRYNNKLKVMQKAPRKVYVVDNGFVQGAGFNLSENLGRLLAKSSLNFIATVVMM